jgi:RNA polymerase sigma factor (sigma-70 family)
MFGESPPISGELKMDTVIGVERSGPRCNAGVQGGHVKKMKRDSAVAEALPREIAERRFSGLYQEHMRELLGYSLRRCADPDEAADVVAETFLIAWRRLGDVPQSDEARLWLYGTARNVLANQKRGARRRDALTQRLREELHRQLPAHRPEERGTFLEALAGLGEADRELLTLIGWEELTPTQAARALGITPFAARTRLHRARRRLQALLDEQPPRNRHGSEIEVEEAR